MKPRDDEQMERLLGQIARGEESALASLYDRTCALVNGLALRILKDRQAAEEVTLDVYLQVWRQADRYDAARGNPLAWLLTLARSRAIDRFRANAQAAQSKGLDDAVSLASVEPDPEENTLISERRRLVAAALARLAPEQRQVVELAYFAGLSHSAIAARLDQPLGTVKTRARLGMTRLREALAGTGVDFS